MSHSFKGREYQGVAEVKKTALARGPHTHRCIRKAGGRICRRRFVCEQACDPHAKDDSICKPCFDEEQFA